MIKPLLKTLNYLAKFKYQNYINYERKKNPDIFYTIDRILNDFHSSGGLNWTGQDFKLFHLFNICKTTRPISIIEFGSGSSTAIICEYIKNNNCKLITIDESEEWLENTKNLCLDRCNRNISFISAKRIENMSVLIPTCEYEYVNSNIFDFAIVDGPSLSCDPQIRSKQVCVDVLHLRFPDKKATIAIDGRFSTCRYLEHKLGSMWGRKASTNKYFASTLLKKDYRSYSLFQR